MSVSTLSESSQNYVKAVWSLAEWSDEPVTASTVAARVGVKLSTASDAIRKLTEQGLLEHARYGSVNLTPEGRAHAVAMVRRHRLIETFLVDVLGYEWDQVHDEAEALEHAVSDFLVERIDVHLGHPTRDPHGDTIPTAAGEIERPTAVPLGSLGADRRARVERIADDDPGLLQFFAEHGIRWGCEIETRPAAPYSDTVEIVIRADDEFEGNAGGAEWPRLPLGRAAADAVWVQPLD